MISCSTNPNCKMIDECEKKIDCTTYMELSEGLTRYICGREPCKYTEKVNHPSHYCKNGRKECIVEMEEKYGIPATVGFCLMNAYKYLYRAGDKFGNSALQDESKARWYFDYANQMLEYTDNGECFKKSSDLYLDIKEMLENE